MRQARNWELKERDEFFLPRIVKASLKIAAAAQKPASRVIGSGGVL